LVVLTVVGAGVACPAVKTGAPVGAGVGKVLLVGYGVGAIVGVRVGTCGDHIN
jgi:hypothetical protein